MLNEEGFQEWKQLEITKAIFKALRYERERLKEALVSGGVGIEDREGIMGRCQAVGAILDMSFEDLTDSLKEIYGN